MAAEIEVAGQFGSPEASDAVVPVFMTAMKPAGATVPLHSLDDRVRTLSLLLRVSGRVQKFEGEPVENVKFARNREWASVDLLVWEREWEGKPRPAIAAVLADRVRGVPAVLEPLFRKKGLRIDRGGLAAELERFGAAFQQLAARL